MNWTVRRKVAVILLSSLIGIVILSSFMGYATLTENRLNNKVKAINEGVYQAQAISQDMESARKNDQIFIYDPSHGQEKTVTDNIKQLEHDVKALHALNIGINQDTQTIEKGIQSYSKAFNQLKKTKTTIGYSDTEGILGQIANSELAIQDILSSMNVTVLNTPWLQIESAKMRFMSNPLPQYIATLPKDIQAMDGVAKQHLKDATLDKYKSNSTQFLQGLQQLNQLYQEQTSTIKNFNTIGSTVIHEVDQTVQRLNQRRNQLYNKQSSTQTLLFVSMLVLGLVILIIIGLFGGWLYKSIIRSIQTLKEGAMRIGDGKLNHRVAIEGEDEFSQLGITFNKMAESVRQMIHKVNGAASELSSASQNLTAVSEETTAQSLGIHQTIEQVTEGAQHQVLHLQESIELLNKVTDAITETTAITNRMTEQSDKAQHAHQQGLKVVAVLQEDSAQFLDIAKHLIIDIQEISKQSSEIVGILKVMKDISSNTDLLALNAAIESARAGEVGYGFAVVSHEIRKLAERSKKETNTIEQVIHHMISQLNDITERANQLNHSLGQQDHNVKQTKGAFDAIDENVDSINQGITNIQTAITNVSTANTELATKLEEISTISEETAASTEQAAAASESQTSAIETVNQAALSLQDISLVLEQEVIKFEIGDEKPAEEVARGEGDGHKATASEENIG
ncbi:hypothetical protein GCM10011391_05830 [Pullulanibacillus camelliae]|uniref:Methyl-accepting chemotaxis protein n=1 Tax=Pullulanibacillus camelliae TaxID=1707096 RepID=A0A8J2YC89_9BACL|nr:methyl-accepting chemotaxis protein [Pullulanibacillus camelliae]GGE30098.1 hypothetical protein GCM10011391_05830 [Pullulanibacillus camelliae]